MAMQKHAFLDGEGDAYFTRNASKAAASDSVLEGLSHLGATPSAVVEVGCGTGRRLRVMAKRFGAKCYGFDPSAKAISEAAAKWPEVAYSVGTADKLDMPNASADVLIFGFCLYLTDPDDHFTIAAEANRVLRDGGILCIHDFLPRSPHKNPYSHFDGLYSHKMEFARMFDWHPSYRLIHRTYGQADGGRSFSQRESWGCDFLLKQSKDAFPRGLS